MHHRIKTKGDLMWMHKNFLNSHGPAYTDLISPMITVVPPAPLGTVLESSIWPSLQLPTLKVAMCDVLHDLDVVEVCTRLWELPAHAWTFWDDTNADTSPLSPLPKGLGGLYRSGSLLTAWSLAFLRDNLERQGCLEQWWWKFKGKLITLPFYHSSPDSPVDLLLPPLVRSHFSSLCPVRPDGSPDFSDTLAPNTTCLLLGKQLRGLPGAGRTSTPISIPTECTTTRLLRPRASTTVVSTQQSLTTRQLSSGTIPCPMSSSTGGGPLSPPISEEHNISGDSTLNTVVSTLKLTGQLKRKRPDQEPSSGSNKRNHTVTATLEPCINTTSVEAPRSLRDSLRHLLTMLNGDSSPIPVDHTSIVWDWAEGHAHADWTFTKPPWHGKTSVSHPSLQVSSHRSNATEQVPNLLWRSCGTPTSPVSLLLTDILGDGYCLSRSLALSLQVMALSGHTMPPLPQILLSGQVDPVSALLPNLWALLYHACTLSDDLFRSTQQWPFPGKDRISILRELMLDQTLQMELDVSHPQGSICNRALNFLRSPSTHCGLIDVLVLAVAMGVNVRFFHPDHWPGPFGQTSSIVSWLRQLALANVSVATADSAHEALAIIDSTTDIESEFTPSLALLNAQLGFRTTQTSLLNHWVALLPRSVLSQLTQNGEISALSLAPHELMLAWKHHATNAGEVQAVGEPQVSEWRVAVDTGFMENTDRAAGRQH